MNLVYEQATLAKSKPTGIYRCFAPRDDDLDDGLSALIKTMSKEQKHTQQRTEALPNDFRVEKNHWQEDIYEYLYQSNRLDDSYPFSPNQHNVHMPNTVTYKYQRANGWYYALAGENGMLRKKDKNKDLAPDEIINALCSGTVSRSGIVACWVSGEDKPGEAGTTCPTIEYFDEQRLESFLLHREKPPTGYLQQFIEPSGERNSMIRASWSPFNTKVELCSNCHKIDDASLPPTRRVVTFDGEAHDAEIIVLFRSALSKRVGVVVSRMMRHLHALLPKSYRVWNAVFYFKTQADSSHRANTKLWFLSCGSIRLARTELQRDHDDKMRPKLVLPAAPTSVGPQLVSATNNVFRCPNCSRPSPSSLPLRYKQIVLYFKKQQRRNNDYGKLAKEGELKELRPRKEQPINERPTITDAQIDGFLRIDQKMFLEYLRDGSATIAAMEDVDEIARYYDALSTDNRLLNSLIEVCDACCLLFNSSEQHTLENGKGSLIHKGFDTLMLSWTQSMHTPRLDRSTLSCQQLAIERRKKHEFKQHDAAFQARTYGDTPRHQQHTFSSSPWLYVDAAGQLLCSSRLWKNHKGDKLSVVEGRGGAKLSLDIADNSLQSGVVGGLNRSSVTRRSTSNVKDYAAPVLPSKTITPLRPTTKASEPEPSPHRHSRRVIQPVRKYTFDGEI